MFSTNGNYYDPKAENHTGLGVAPLIKPSSEELPIDVDVSVPSEYAMPMGTHSLPPGSASDGETADNNRTAVKPPVTRSASVSNIQTITLPTDPVPRLSAPTRPAPTHSSSSRLMSMSSDPRRLQPIPEYHKVVSFTPTQSRPTPSARTQPAPTHSGQAKSTPMYPTPAQSGRINSVPEGSGSTQSLSADSVQRQLTPSDLNHTVSVPEHSMQGSSASGGWSAPATGQYPKGDFRNSSQEALRDIQSTIMVNWLRQTQMERLWSGTLPGEGAVLKKGRGSFTCCPETLQNDSSEFYSQIVAMNVRCAITVSTPVINLFLTRHSADYVPLTDDLRIQVLPSVALLSSGQKHHFGAFIKDQRRLIVWDDDPKRVLERAEYILDSLVQMIWNQTEPAFDTNKQDANARIPDTERRTVTAEELEQGMIADKRPTLLINPIMVGITIALLISALGFGWRDLAQQVSVDHNYIRLAILAVTPSQVFVSLFFMQTIIVNLGQILGPINQLKINSKFYSGKPPPRLDRNLKTLPHMTIQMPVYKEGLRTVIQPTIRSLKAALSTYELQGGTGNIFVNDDGMQLLPDEEAQARKDFYDEHNIGWVARPEHNPKPNDGEKLFIRGGKFKKASNMNFALMISIKVEEALLNIQRDINWNQNKEQAAYQQCLAEVLEEDQHAWAAGDIRVGDYILLIDSDTRVPVDCLLDAASEMELSPQVAIMQYASGVMTVTDSFFEKGVTFFTNLIYTAIRYTVANGDVAPFVGHNAILRWSALQQVAYKDKEGPDKIWSESHVSEDFDMSLRLQIAGYTVRLGSYQGDGFKEGVSLTVYDELSRWEKYAYGCNELLFHPLQFWITRGPFTPLFRKFIFSNIRLTSKITIMAYIGTYYAIAAAWLLTLANYFIIGWFNGYIDHYYIDSFKVYFSLVVVFSAMGNFGLAILRYRLSEKSLLSATSENFKWLILLTIFLGGASLHISQAIFCHFLGINMTWGATAKEAEDISFFEEIPRLLSRFKFTFLFCFVCTGIIVAGVLFVPWPWQITDFVAIFPLTILVVSHFFLPVALNPALMQFTW